MAKSKKAAPKKAAKKSRGTVVFNNGELKATGKVAKSLSEHPRNHGAFTKGSREKVSADYYARQQAIGEARPGIQLAVRELLDSLSTEDRKQLLEGLREGLISNQNTQADTVVNLATGKTMSESEIQPGALFLGTSSIIRLLLNQKDLINIIGETLGRKIGGNVKAEIPKEQEFRKGSSLELDLSAIEDKISINNNLLELILKYIQKL